MSTPQHRISAEAEAARERARDHGKFGTQNLNKSNVTVPTPVEPLSVRINRDRYAADDVVRETQRRGVLDWNPAPYHVLFRQYLEKFSDHGDESTDEFPYGKMWHNVNTLTGEPDFERVDADGVAHPVPPRDRAAEKIAVDDCINDLWDNYRRDKYRPDRVNSGFAERCGQMVTDTGGLFDLTLQQSRDAIDQVGYALRDQDRDGLEIAVANMMEQQQSDGRMVRPDPETSTATPHSR